MCPVRWQGLHLYQLFVAGGRPPPDPLSEDWTQLALWPDKDPYSNVTRQGMTKAFTKMWEDAQIFIEKSVHAGRAGGARALDEAGADEKAIYCIHSVICSLSLCCLCCSIAAPCTCSLSFAAFDRLISLVLAQMRPLGVPSASVCLCSASSA